MSGEALGNAKGPKRSYDKALRGSFGGANTFWGFPTPNRQVLPLLHHISISLQNILFHPEHHAISSLKPVSKPSIPAWKVKILDTRLNSLSRELNLCVNGRKNRTDMPRNLTVPRMVLSTSSHTKGATASMGLGEHAII